MDAKELIAFLRQHADWREEGFGAQAPEIVAHVKKLRAWADQLAALPSDAAQAPEPVAWQWRAIGHDWSRSQTFLYKPQFTEGVSEIRPLYAAPVVPQATGDAAQAPIYQYRLVSGEWVDFPEQDGRMHIERGHTVRIVYAAPVAPAAVAPSEAEFALRALVAAGHVSQSKVDEALRIARKTPGVAPHDERPDPDDIQGWSVTVNVNATDILTIGHNSVSGIEGLDDFAPVVRNCAEHLLAFMGKGDAP